MRSPWEVLGQDSVILEISQELSRDRDFVPLIEGPPGTGKSWIGRGIGALWNRQGGATIIAEGDRMRRTQSLYPFRYAAAPVSRGLPSGVANLARVAEGVLLPTGGLLSATADAAVNARRDRQQVYLGADQHEIVRDLERQSAGKPLLLIVDNFHWWDAASIVLLDELRRPELRRALPFLDALRLLLIETPERYQTVTAPDEHSEFVSSSVNRRVAVKPVEAHQFRDLLESLDAPTGMPDEVVSALHSLSGGHLALVDRVAKQLKAAGASAEAITHHDKDAFAARLARERIHGLGEVGQQVEAMLRYAAAIGLISGREALVCASGLPPSEAARVLRVCRDERLIDFDADTTRFAHDIFRDIFLALEDDDRVQVRDRLVDCLRRVDSANYVLRADNALAAERPQDAVVLVVLAVLKRWRDGQPWDNLRTDHKDLLAASGFDRVIPVFIESLEHVRDYRLRSALESIDRLPPTLPRPLAAEADYVRAMAWMATRDEADRDRARSILSAWEGYEQTEPEIGVRLARLLLYGLSHVKDKSQGLELEMRLLGFLQERMSHDREAADQLNVLYRCAGSLYAPDVAIMRTASAVRHFEPRSGETVVGRPIEYYRSLVNHGANQIVMCRYGEAIETYRRVDALIDVYGTALMPRPDYPASNMILARFRFGDLSAAQAADAQREIMAQHISDDPFFVASAAAAYTALAGNPTAALDSFARLEDRLRRLRDHPEPSMAYLLRSNMCIAAYLSGDREVAARDWHELTPLVRSIPYTIAPYLVRRHELMSALLDTATEWTPGELDEVLVHRSPLELGPSWPTFARAFRIPEIEFWRES